MTEAEAKTKQCCGPQGCGQVQPPDSGTHWPRTCVGAQCMAWRLAKPNQSPSDGYCGLAGSP